MLSRFLNHRDGKVCFQPRMGVKCIDSMAAALQKIKALSSPIGTLTLDSFSRQYDIESIERVMNGSGELNGFPLIFYDHAEIKEKMTSLQDDTFLIQVRHGMANPYEMVKHMIRAGLIVTEGGPISYCLPYSRLPLEKSLGSWQKTVGILADNGGHLETFSGCMMGQLSPPSLLIALNIIEGLFFANHGLSDMSFSYAQSYNLQQDYAALCALKTLVDNYFGTVNYHIVVYTFMGIYPETVTGHKNILFDSYKLAQQSKSRRLIYKTRYESSRIPSISENMDELQNLMKIDSLQETDNRNSTEKNDNTLELDTKEYNRILQEAEILIQNVIHLSPDLNASILTAFDQGILDVPYCLHPQNKGNTQSWIQDNGQDKGYVRWHHPLLHKNETNLFSPLSKHPSNTDSASPLSSDLFLKSLYYNRTKYDSP